MTGLLGIGMAVAFFSFGLFQTYAAFVGISDAHGWGWSILAILLAIFARFTLPMTYGCYLYASNVLEWPWYGAVLFAAPLLVIMIPSFLASIVPEVARRR